MRSVAVDANNCRLRCGSLTKNYFILCFRHLDPFSVLPGVAWTAERFFVSNFSLTGGFCDDAVPLMWPGGASAVSVAAELLAGPMWGGREGGPGCPSGQPGKRPTRSRLRRNAITQQTAC